jgi:peptidoglycan L-alanyl-D-glutamate endopeptidase CwlK
MSTTPDKATLDRIAQAHPKVREELGKIYQTILTKLTGKSHCRFAYVVRTFAEQTALYNQGRNGNPGPVVTNAPAGLSIHNYGLAADIVLLVDKLGNGTFSQASWDTITDFDGDGISDWMEVVAVFKSFGWSWGGDWASFKDLPHFEKTFGHKPSDLLALYKSGKKDAQGYVII